MSLYQLKNGYSLPKNSLAVMPLPLYAGLTVDEQLQVFEPTPKYTRKVIVSTNIAEASVTLEGVVYVIDTGFVKVNNLIGSYAINSLIEFAGPGIQSKNGHGGACSYTCL